MDWKEALLAQSRAMGIEPEPQAEETADACNPAENDSYLKSPLHIIMERKGRAGKTATIIEGFTCTPARLKEIASSLRQKLGTGGSVRGCEILIQGDRREDVFSALRNMGFSRISK